MDQSNTARILVVDDQPHNIDVIRRLMTRRGYDIVAAADGASALQSVARDRVDLVLLDVNMPGMAPQRCHSSARGCSASSTSMMR